MYTYVHVQVIHNLQVSSGRQQLASTQHSFHTSQGVYALQELPVELTSAWIETWGSHCPE